MKPKGEAKVVAIGKSQKARRRQSPTSIVRHKQAGSAPPTHRMSGPLEIQGEVCSQLATRIPRGLRRRVRLHCLEEGANIQQFVTDALRERIEEVTTK